MAKQDKDIEVKQRSADQILQGIRIVLPGTQALMGFQFIAFFNPVFQGLSSGLKHLHFITLVLTIACSLFLIAPVSFQQISEAGHPTDRFLAYTRKMLAIAMFCLLLAISGDIYVAARTAGLSHTATGAMAAVLFSAGMFLWYVYALICRRNSSTQ